MNAPMDNSRVGRAPHAVGASHGGTPELQAVSAPRNASSFLPIFVFAGEQ